MVVRPVPELISSSRARADGPDSERSIPAASRPQGLQHRSFSSLPEKAKTTIVPPRLPWLAAGDRGLWLGALKGRLWKL